MFADLVFLGDFCNLQCIYCSAGATRWRQINGRLEAMRPGGARTTVDTARLERDLLGLVDVLAGEGVTALKLSGGEIFVQPALAGRIIDHTCRRMDMVQVLTNATRIPELLRLLDRHSNLHVQVSLDGATADTNLARSRLESQTLLVRRNIETLAGRVPLEVNVVLTRWNTCTLPEFLGWLAALDGDVIAYPFPVRGSPYRPPVDPADSANHAFYERSERARGPFLPSPDDHADLRPRPQHLVGLDVVLMEYGRLDSVLPPRSYLEALRTFLAAGNRRRDCGVPRAIKGIDQDGVQAVCPCGDLGNAGTVAEGLQRLDPDPVWGPPCAGCFTHYEVLHHVADPAEVRQSFTRALVTHYLAEHQAPVVR